MTIVTVLSALIIGKIAQHVYNRSKVFVWMALCLVMLMAILLVMALGKAVFIPAFLLFR